MLRSTANATAITTATSLWIGNRIQHAVERWVQCTLAQLDGVQKHQRNENEKRWKSHSNDPWTIHDNHFLITLARRCGLSLFSMFPATCDIAFTDASDRAALSGTLVIWAISIRLILCLYYLNCHCAFVEMMLWVVTCDQFLLQPLFPI